MDYWIEQGLEYRTAAKLASMNITDIPSLQLYLMSHPVGCENLGRVMRFEIKAYLSKVEAV